MKSTLRDRTSGFARYVYKNRYLYSMAIPGFVFLILFKYVPMYGVIMAFQDFSFKKGIFGSPFNHFAHFKALFSSPRFYRVLSNSLTLSLIKLVFSFPVPIFLALLLNEIRCTTVKRIAQTMMYLPHFISWVVMAGITVNFLGFTDGLVNEIIVSLGGTRLNFLGSANLFRPIIVGTGIWKGAGWGTIIYLAALSGINPEYYEAARVDGAGRLQQIRHITLPGIASTIVILLVLEIGSLLGNGFEQIYLFQNDLNLSVSDVFETYTYELGLISGRFSYSTAVGLFTNVVGMVLLLLSNTIAKKLGGSTLY